MCQYSVTWYIAVMIVVMNGIVIVAISKYWMILSNLLPKLFRFFLECTLASFPLNSLMENWKIYKSVCALV